MGHQAIRHFPEGLAHGELAQDQRLFLLGLGGLEGNVVITGGENRERQGGADIPEVRGPGEQACQVNALGAGQAGVGNPGKKIDPGRTDTVVGGDARFAPRVRPSETYYSG